MKLNAHADVAERRLRAALGKRPLAEPAVAEVAPPLAETPTGLLLQSSVDPKRSGSIALVGFAIVAAIFAGVLAFRARPRAAEVPRPIQRVGTSASGTPRASAATVIVVDVAGGVRRPGLQRLPPGSRVADALAAAGGVLPGKSAQSLNLARKLIDGEQLLVGAPAPPGTAAAATVGPPSETQPLNLNAATAAQLETLPGVGPVLAQRIAAWRTEHGGFTSVDQLREIEGIGDRTFASLRSQVAV